MVVPCIHHPSEERGEGGREEGGKEETKRKQAELGQGPACLSVDCCRVVLLQQSTHSFISHSSPSFADGLVTIFFGL